MMTTSTRVEDARLRGMLTSCEGVTPGPWFQTGSPWFRDGTGVLAGSPDGNVAYLIADTDDFALPRDEYEGFPLGDKEADAKHLANCDPDTIRSILSELLELREALDEWAKARAATLAEPAVADVRTSETFRAALNRLSNAEDALRSLSQGAGHEQ